MTLEEMGHDYLRQADLIQDKIDKLEEDIHNHETDLTCNFAQKMQDIKIMKELHLELTINGYKLINYYRR